MNMGIVLSLVVALLCAGLVQAGDLEDGIAAYDRKDYATALAKFSSATRQGNARAQNFIGEMYEKGHGVAQDYAEAVRWYHQAAQQGDARAQCKLGFLYANGKGVARDYKESVRWVRLAAAQGDVDAHYNLGVHFVRGIGVSQNLIKAHMWFDIAAVSSDAIPLRNRELVAAKMTPQQISEAQNLASECQARNFKNCD